MSSEISLFYVTFPDAEIAESICRRLIEEKLIACANIQSPQLAIYPWKGKIESATEIGAWLKSKTSLRQMLESRLSEFHPFETPCLIEIRAASVNAEYQQWLMGSF